MTQLQITKATLFKANTPMIGSHLGVQPTCSKQKECHEVQQGWLNPCITLPAPTKSCPAAHHPPSPKASRHEGYLYTPVLTSSEARG